MLIKIRLYFDFGMYGLSWQHHSFRIMWLRNNVTLRWCDLKRLSDFLMYCENDSILTALSVPVTTQPNPTISGHKIYGSYIFEFICHVKTNYTICIYFPYFCWFWTSSITLIDLALKSYPSQPPLHPVSWVSEWTFAQTHI